MRTVFFIVGVLTMGWPAVAAEQKLIVISGTSTNGATNPPSILPTAPPIPLATNQAHPSWTNAPQSHPSTNQPSQSMTNGLGSHMERP